MLNNQEKGRNSSDDASPKRLRAPTLNKGRTFRRALRNQMQSEPVIVRVGSCQVQQIFYQRIFLLLIKMDNSAKKFPRREPANLPSSMTDARFVQSLLLATPLYFYYQHLTPPGYFSSLLKGLVHMRKANEEQNVTVECGINLTRNATQKMR